MSVPAQSGSPPLRRRVRNGALAGLAGGAVFAAAMLQLGDALPAIAGIVRSDRTAIGLVVHAIVAALIGMAFGVLTRGERYGAGELVFWGMGYGALWWLLGGLTALPLLRGVAIDWSLAAAQAALPSLLGHILYGAAAGAVLAALGGASRPSTPARGALVRGALAGVLTAAAILAVLGRCSLLGAAGFAGEAGARWGLGLTLGGLAGAGYGALYPQPRGTIGPGLIRGMAYGFLLWVVVAMTLVPLVGGDGLAWQIAQARSRAASLPAIVLGGAVLVAVYRAISALVGTVIEDDPGELADEGVGTRALRALGRGTVGGLAGGALFTLGIARIGGLERIAGLGGGSSVALGLSIHLLIAILIGASYGLLFRHEGSDPESALGWGVAYGLLWWLLGGLTLLPVLLGNPPSWTAAELAGAFPSLVGHLVYGAGLGLGLGWLEHRSNPWWTATTAARARRAQLRRRSAAATAPGLWTVSAVAVLTALVLVSEP